MCLSLDFSKRLEGTWTMTFGFFETRKMTKFSCTSRLKGPVPRLESWKTHHFFPVSTHEVAMCCISPWHINQLGIEVGLQIPPSRG